MFPLVGVFRAGLIDVIATLFDMVGSIFDNISKGRAELNVMTQRELLASTEMTAERHG